MAQAPAQPPLQKSGEEQQLSRLRWLADVAYTDVAAQRELTTQDLVAKPGAELPVPSPLLYRMVRLLPLRQLLGRRLGGAVHYQSGRLVADSIDVGSIADIAAYARELGLGGMREVHGGADELVLDVTDCLACRGLPNIGEKVCHFEAGLISRLIEKALVRRAHTREERCWANGDDRCRFHTSLGPPDSAPANVADVCLDWNQDPVEIMASLVGSAGQAMRLAAELRQKNHELSLLATTDSLTGLLNRRAFIEQLESEIDRATRYGVSLALAMIDVDHFKQVNDTRGHTQGDRVLNKLAQLLLAETRKTDVVARHGGEEFTILSPHLTSSEAFRAMDRLRACVARELADPPVTVSIGVAAIPPSPPELDVLLSAADKALYAAKAQGRNRVVVNAP